MNQGVAEFAAFVNRTRGFRGDVAGDTAGKRELFEQPFDTLFVFGNVRVIFGISPFEIGVGDQTGPPCPGLRCRWC